MGSCNKEQWQGVEPQTHTDTYTYQRKHKRSDRQPGAQTEERSDRHRWATLRSKGMAGAQKQHQNLHGPHLNHVPLDTATLPALVRLGMPVAVQLQIEYIIVGLLVCSVGFFLPA